MTRSVEDQAKVFELGAKFWQEARDWGRLHKLLSPSEYGVLDTCSKIPSRIPTERQTKVALQVLAKLEENGFGADKEIQVAK